MRYFISFFIFSLYLHGFNYHLKPYQISEGINCFFGLPSQVSNINGGNMINSCYVETSEGYVVIDSGPTYSYAQAAYAVMKKKKNLPVKYVINTSWDEVHILGNEFYREMGAKLLGPNGYKENIETRKVLHLSKKITKDALFNTRVVPLDEYIKSDKRLHFKTMNIDIKTLHNNDNDLYVYIKEKNIVFAGDLIYNNRIPIINHGRSFLNWLAEIDKLSALEWSDIISAHGYKTRRSALQPTKDYLSFLQNEILKKMHKGASLEKIQTALQSNLFKRDTFYKSWHTKNIMRVYEELKVLEKKKISKKTKEVLPFKQVEDKKKPKVTVMVMPKATLQPTLPLTSQIVVKEINLKYKSFTEALSSGKKDKKIILLKVRSTGCKYCDELDRMISENNKVEKILNQYFEMVEINLDEESIPLDIRIQSTPTLVFIEAENKKVLMKIAGIRALGELVEVLNEAIEDGHNGGYLKP